MNDTILELINRRERQLLLHAALYYEFGKNIISDDQYDKWSFELDKLIKDNPKEFNNSSEHENFLTFDPSSGYYLNYTNFIDRAACVYNDYCRLNNIKDHIQMEDIKDHIARIKGRK